VDARTTDPGDAAARRGLLFVVVAIALLPVVVGLMAAMPHAARGAVFEVGLLCVAALAIWGGVLARQALQSGTRRALSAYVAAVLGLLVGITLVLVGISAAVALFA
jgi:hypothetical protein